MSQISFEDVANRYGLSMNAITDAWSKTRGLDPETRVKAFKSYLYQLSGVVDGQVKYPINDAPLEEMAIAFLNEEVDNLEVMVKETLKERYETRFGESIE